MCRPERVDEVAVGAFPGGSAPMCVFGPARGSTRTGQQGVGQHEVGENASPPEYDATASRGCRNRGDSVPVENLWGRGEDPVRVAPPPDPSTTGETAWRVKRTEARVTPTTA